MKRTPIKRKTPLRSRTALKSAKTPSSARAAERPQKRPRASKVELCHLRAVKALRCVVCGRAGPNDAHHCFHDRATRFGGRKAGHFETIPLCKEHHQHGPDAIHNAKRTWRERWGPDHGYIESVMIAIYGVAEPGPDVIQARWNQISGDP